MPRQYTAMRDKFAKGATSGPSYDAAQSKAARIYNSKHPDSPVTGRSEETGETAPDNERREKRPRSKSKKKSRAKKGQFNYLNRKAM